MTPSEKKQGPRKKPASRRRKTAPLGQVTKPLLSRVLRRKGFVRAEVVARWPHIVGDDLARGTLPTALKFPPGDRVGGTLYVQTIPAFAPLIAHREQEIIDLVNQFFGFGAVARVAIRQGPLPVQQAAQQSPLPEMTDADRAALRADIKVKDPGLSDALTRLAWAMRSRNK